MVLYRGVEITCRKDIFDALSQASSDFPGYFEFVSSVIGDPSADLREALSAKSLWSLSASEDDLAGCLVRLKLGWMEALYSALRYTLTASHAQQFHVLGHRLFPSALFFHPEHGEDICIIAGATSTMLERLTLCGANIKRVDPSQKENLPDSGIVVSLSSRVNVQIAAAVLVESVFPPFKTTKHSSRVPSIIADFSFVNSTRRILRLEDLSPIRRDDNSATQVHRYRVGGLMSEETARYISRIALGLLERAENLVARGPLQVPRYGIDSSVKASSMALVTNGRENVTNQVKSLKNPFLVVKSRPKPSEELLHKRDASDTSSAADATQGTTFIRCLVEEWSQPLSIQPNVLKT